LQGNREFSKPLPPSGFRRAPAAPRRPRPDGPCYPPGVAAQIEALAGLLTGRRVVALTGAGCSTDSGIPDYRGEGTRRRARNPIQHRAFTSDPAARRRYWARAVVGWPRFRTARSNAGHRALAALEAAGLLRGLITQNVDRLHQGAGSRRVVELHGALQDVRCLDCGERSDRDAVQARLEALNPGWSARAAELAPDGDAELPDEVVARFRPVRCSCGGDLKPDVVFFGAAVPRATVAAAEALLAEGDALLVLGTSLAVLSGYRFVRAARRRGTPVAVVNLGPTRADADAALKVEAPLGAVLPALLARLAAADGRPAPPAVT